MAYSVKGYGNVGGVYLVKELSNRYYWESSLRDIMDKVRLVGEWPNPSILLNTDDFWAGGIAWFYAGPSSSKDICQRPYFAHEL